MQKRDCIVMYPLRWGTAKLLLIMRLSSFLLLVTCMQVSAGSFAQKVTLKEKNAALPQIFNSIKKQTGYSFFYDEAWLKQSTPVTIEVKNAHLKNVLDICFSNQPLSYAIVGNTVVIKLKEQKVIQATEIPEKANISGVVNDQDGATLPGVSVQVEGTQRGTTTDGSGNFTIDVNPGETLVFSMVGYKQFKYKVGNNAIIKIQLEIETSEMTDVVVVGYGTQKKIASTGSIASVKAADITQTPVTNVAQGLAARVSGVQITQNNAAPGGNISVRIRGTNSINGSSEPLYIVDGIQVTNSGGVNDVSPLSTINPNDIESVEVLKDASAAAIYGARGANGVILITTKRGKKGVTNVQLDSYIGTQSITRKLNMMNATQFAELENDIYNTDVYANPQAEGEGTNWQDIVYRKAPIQNYQLSVSGGSDKTTFSLSGNFFKQEGIIINSQFNRYSFRATLDHTISKHFKTGTSILTSYTTNNNIPTGIESMDGPVVTQSIVGATLGAPPTMVPYTADGKIFPFADQLNSRYREISNPLGLASILNKNNIRRNLINVYLEAKANNHLSYRASFNADMGSTLNDYYSPISIIGVADRNANSGTARKGNSNALSWLMENIVTYDRSFGDHSLKLTGVQAYQQIDNNSNSLSATGFPNDATTNESVGLATNLQVNSFRSKEILNSWMGRLNYGYADKYFVDITARYDGVSKFGENHKWGFFPAIAGAWRIIEESFMRSNNFFSDLKLRASYGLTGNAGALYPYQSLALIGGGSNYQLDHNYVIGLSPTGIPNPDLRWEKSAQTNIGIDIGILNNRLNFVFDYYNKTTNDLLFVKNLPLSAGYASVVGNFASIQNKGVEFAVDAKILTGTFKWSANANITRNRNKLLSLADGVQEFILNPYSVLKVGQPIGIFKSYVFEGVYQTGETVLPGSGSRIGGIKVEDLNKDGEITAEDQRITGNANPNYIFGFSSNMSYKNFDLAIFVSGVQGNQIFNLSRYTFENPMGGRNVVVEQVNRWSPTNPSNEYASGFQGGRLPVSDRFVEDGSFVRLKNVSLGYRFTNIKFLNSLRVYVSANNLLTLTKYSGYDPEVNTFGGSNTLIGIDNLVYPVSRSFIGGIQVNF